MQALADLDLPHLPMEAPEFAADPFPYLAAARAKHPWLAAAEHGYVVHEYDAMRELMGQDDKLRTAHDGVAEVMGAAGTPWGRWMTEEFTSLPPAQHLQIRQAFAASFTPRFANELRPRIRATITRLLDEWAPKGGFGFDEFASWFPISIMFAMVGAPVDRIGAVKADLETLGLAFGLDRDLAPALNKAFERVDALVEELIAERRADPHVEGAPDLLDVMIQASDVGGVSSRQMADLIIDLFVAANDTTKCVLTTIMWLLIDRPETYRRCAEDFDYCRRVVDETLRYLGPSTAMRLTTQDVAFRDVLLPKGTTLFFPFSIAGRDPGAFPDADRFDPDRPVDPHRRHVAFGLGHHMCPGQFIARAELQEGLHLVAQRLREPQLAGAYGWRPFPGIWGLKGLPITFTPAEPDE